MIKYSSLFSSKLTIFFIKIRFRNVIITDKKDDNIFLANNIFDALNNI